MELLGVGATAERKVEELQPLVEYFEREMGPLAGRLMLAASLLRDAAAVAGLPEGVASALDKGEALTVSVMVRLMAEDERCGCCDPDEIVEQARRLIGDQGEPS